MKSLLPFLAFIFSLTATSQVPEPHMLSMRGIGGNGSDQLGSNVTKTNDGGFILRIETNSSIGSGNMNVFCEPTQKRMAFVKYNYDASVVEWSKCYGFAGDSFLTHIFPKNDGSVVLGGLFNSTVAWGWLIAKHDAAGNVLWQRNYSKGMGSVLRDMMPTNDGGYIMLGESHQTDTNVLMHYGSWSTFDLWVLKVDSNGYKVWSKVIGGSYDEGAIALVPAPGNGCYVLGATQSSDYDCTGYHAGGQDAYLARLDADGNILWHRCLGGGGYEAGYNSGSGVADGNGGILIAVSTTSADGDVQNHIYETDYWVLNVDSNGAIIWDNCYNKGTYEFPSSICKANDGSIWINGWSSNNYDDVFVIHTDSIGVLQSSAILTSTSKERGQMIYALANGNVLAGGYYSTNTGHFSPLNQFGAIDIFLSVFANWDLQIDHATLFSAISVYPNPVRGLLHIQTKQSNHGYTIELTNAVGKRIYSGNLKAGDDELQIDVNKFAKGIYHLLIKNETGDQHIEQIMIH